MKFNQNVITKCIADKFYAIYLFDSGRNNHKYEVYLNYHF